MQKKTTTKLLLFSWFRLQAPFGMGYTATLLYRALFFNQPKSPPPAPDPLEKCGQHPVEQAAAFRRHAQLEDLLISSRWSVGDCPNPVFCTWTYCDCLCRYSGFNLIANHHQLQLDHRTVCDGLWREPFWDKAKLFEVHRGTPRSERSVCYPRSNSKMTEIQSWLWLSNQGILAQQAFSVPWECFDQKIQDHECNTLWIRNDPNFVLETIRLQSHHRRHMLKSH